VAKAVVIAFAVVVAGCGGGPRPSSTVHRSPRIGAAPTAAPTLDVSQVPAGRIAYMRVDADKVERYFTVDAVGANEHALFETQFCACIRWSADGTQIWTVTETETGRPGQYSTTRLTRERIASRWASGNEPLSDRPPASRS
jgi:hypothetical protein